MEQSQILSQFSKPTVPTPETKPPNQSPPKTTLPDPPNQPPMYQSLFIFKPGGLPDIGLGTIGLGRARRGQREEGGWGGGWCREKLVGGGGWDVPPNHPPSQLLTLPPTTNPPNQPRSYPPNTPQRTAPTQPRSEVWGLGDDRGLFVGGLFWGVRLGRGGELGAAVGLAVLYSSNEWNGIKKSSGRVGGRFRLSWESWLGGRSSPHPPAF